jgi:hypothetical protein
VGMRLKAITQSMKVTSAQGKEPTAVLGPRTKQSQVRLLDLQEKREVPACLRKLKAILLLGGSLRPSALAAAIDRSVLDLPVEAGCTVLGAWKKQAAVLSRAGPTGVPRALWGLRRRRAWRSRW